MGSVLGGGKSAPASTNTVQQQTVPPFLEDAYLEGINRARSVSNESYTPYGGQRLAGFVPEQQQAFDMAQRGIGKFNPVYDAGVASTAASMSPFTAGQLDPYMDPYKAQVTDEIARLGNKNFNENLMPGINDQFTGGGMFGSSRNAVALGRAAENVQQNITGQQGQYLSQGFQNAMQNLQTDKERQQSGAAQLTNQAGQGQQLYGTDVNALAGIGAQKQGQQQTLADIGYNDFLEQQQYPQVQAQFFNNIARGIPQAGLVQSQTQQYGAQGNQLAQALGLGGSLYGAVNGAPEIKAKLNKGGHIKAKKAKAKKSDNIGIGGMMYG